MKLIRPSFKITTKINAERILKDIEVAARTCYKSEAKIEYGLLGKAISARPLIKMLMERGHEAMLEFGGNITVKFICDRGVSHELVRHRLCSFAQESTRYCNYSKDEDIVFIIPPWIKDLNTELCEDRATCVWYDSMERAEGDYNYLLSGEEARKWTPQEARAILPNSLKTEINVSTNIRDWRHIFQLRCSPAAHPQMRELMLPLLEEFKKRIPVLFEDLKF